MVELALDDVFRALANKYRRDILRRCAVEAQSATSLYSVYGLTLAAVAKHIAVLERAGLVITQKRGKERLATLAPQALGDAQTFLSDLESFWTSQLESLDAHLRSNP